MVNDGKFLWADIPNNFPDISVLGYTDAQLDDLKHISLVDAINAVGASPSDLVAILEALREAGALRAELVVI